MSRITRLAAVCATAAGMLSLGSAAAASASGHAAHPPTAAARQAAMAALRHLLASPPAAASRGGNAPALTQVNSPYWAGYVDDNTNGDTYSKVSGRWTQPAITCNPDEDEIAVFWAGIDGYSSPTVEQAGTLAQCYEGSAFYYTWWYMPIGQKIDHIVGSTVQPGDKIAVSVGVTGTNYNLDVTDFTTSGNNVRAKRTCAASTCTDTSAEWIVDSQQSPRGSYPLPDFGTWSVSSAAVTSGGTSGTISSFPDDELTMTQGFTGGYDLATPGPLNSSGNGFTVTWNNSY